ncbi:MAG TPA: hypothetical protein VL327_11170 [Pyrinomonadaceae bacterium]|jgi:hypothetical protein|nr:hypothetical protein [Pyrinomonadaceae bacterium]
MRSGVSATNPECPAIKEVAEALENAYPAVTLYTTNNESPGTRHTSGLAIDIMLNVRNTAERTRAHAIIEVFVRLHPQLHWSDLIYSDFDGSNVTYFHIPAGGGFGGPNGLLQRNPYTQDTRHSDHIHLDWVDFSLKNPPPQYERIPYRWSVAANTVGFRQALVGEFASIP